MIFNELLWKKKKLACSGTSHYFLHSPPRDAAELGAISLPLLVKWVRLLFCDTVHRLIWCFSLP